MQISNLVNDFLKDNIFRIKYLGQEILNLNSRIDDLTIMGYNYKLNRVFLNPFVFKEINRLIVESDIRSIDKNLFKNEFKNLRKIELQIRRSFFIRSVLSG